MSKVNGICLSYGWNEEIDSTHLQAWVQVLFTDTVGFIQKLPTQLVAAFRATLEEIAEAQLLIHVVDVSHPNAAAQSAAVMKVCLPHPAAG